jgi:phosphatidylinositol alpha-mannosyltransferase
VEHKTPQDGTLAGVRILLTTPYDMNVPSGVNNQLWGLYRYLRAHTGAAVKVVGPATHPDAIDDPDVLTAGRVSRLKMNGAVSNLTFDLTIRNRIRDFMRTYRPDIVHYQELFAPVLNAYVLRFSRALNAATFHTYGENYIGYTLAWPYLRYQAGRLHARIAVSEAARQYVARLYPGEYHLIPNAVDCAAAQTDPAPFPRDRHNLLFVGRTTEARKGFSFLLKAYNRLERQYPGQYRLIVAGTGQEAWAEQAGEGDIRWLGHLSEEALHRAYAGCDLLCAPSVGGESFGIVLLEAFVHGKPAVAFLIEGYKDLVGDSPAALLVPNRDDRALAEAVCRVCTDRALYERMGRAARDLAFRYDWRNVGAQIVALYERMLEGTQGRDVSRP